MLIITQHYVLPFWFLCIKFGGRAPHLLTEICILYLHTTGCQYNRFFFYDAGIHKRAQITSSLMFVAATAIVVELSDPHGLFYAF